MPKSKRHVAAFLAVLALGNCAGFDTPDNLEPIAVGDGYQAEYRTPDATRPDAGFLRSAQINAEKCKPLRGGATGKSSGIAAASLRGERLSRNDLVNIRVSGDETFNGDYVVSRDGTIKLPFLMPIRAQGNRTDQIEDANTAQLIANDFSRCARASLCGLRILPLSAWGAGAVFELRAVEIGGVQGDRVDSRRPCTSARQTSLSEPRSHGHASYRFSAWLPTCSRLACKKAPFAISDALCCIARAIVEAGEPAIQRDLFRAVIAFKIPVMQLVVKRPRLDRFLVTHQQLVKARMRVDRAKVQREHVEDHMQWM